MKPPIEVLNDPRVLEDLARVQHNNFKTIIRTLMDSGVFKPEHDALMVKYLGDFDSLSATEQEFHRSLAWKTVQTLAAHFLANSMTPDEYGG